MHLILFKKPARFSHIISFSKYLFSVFHGPGPNTAPELSALEELTGLWGKPHNQQVATSHSSDLFSRKEHILSKAEFTKEMI